MMADDIKKIVTFPNLPTSIKGDGRYVLSLLRSYLKTVNDQLNLANGFTADDVDANNKGEYDMPKNLTLTFDRLGGLLLWDRISDESKLKCYEVRMDSNVGNAYGLLIQTKDNETTILPPSYSSVVYLFAVSTEGKTSNGISLHYTKSRPNAPTNISLTKNNEGTLITFLEIPSDCIGANLYIDGVKYQALDNVVLYHNQDTIRTLEIAYYDQFGEGERGALSCYVPTVTGFYVEKNGADLTFSWDALSLYNVKYVVKVGTTHDWEQGIEIFSTKLNKQNYIYPNSGNWYFMIKAVDDHNNYSSDCAWYLLSADAEINKNIIFNFDQQAQGYSGNKINMYLDSDMNGLRLEESAFNGEYIMNVSLPQKIKARNWIDNKINAVTTQMIRICDMDFSVESYEAEHILVCGIIGDIDGVQVKKQIARYIGADSDDLFNAIVDGTAAANGGSLNENINISIDECRYNKGIFITDTTQLSYDVSIPERFSLEFWIKKKVLLHDCIILVLRGSHTLYVGYDKKQDAFYLRDDVHPDMLTVSIKTLDRDWLFIGISQTIDRRSFFVYGLSYDVMGQDSYEVSPCGSFTQLYCYPKE
ncbi:hypothetical protein SAMN05660299_00181 [Megasphaera paucivorans]|uniref:Uncharacterized protein n=2 Tax=Megasphaera paucivorans TaxID=349095 RepID=A0A1G9QBW6_9FIRM|nr:hypothetical protein SAMN05660299_00181 [Megasphaera paucivorans]